MLGFLWAIGLLGACGDDVGEGDPIEVDLQGAAHKGPFVIGSDVQISQLSGSGSPTGTVFNETTRNDFGEFDLQLSVPDGTLVEIETTGFYFDEAVGGLADATLTLRSVVQLSSESVDTTQNVLTHLSRLRVLALMEEGAEYAAARTQAEQEARDVIGLLQPDGMGFADSLNLLGGDDSGTAWLGAASCQLATAAQLEVAGTASSAAAKLQEILNTLAIDLEADGVLDLPRQRLLDEARMAMDAPRCAEHLKERLVELGDEVTVVPDPRVVLDFDGDGLSDAVDDDVDGDGIPASQEALVMGAASYSAGFSSDGEFLGTSLVVLDNIIGNNGGQAWVLTLFDTGLGLNRSAPFRIESQDGPLTGVISVSNRGGDPPYYLVDTQGRAWVWSPGGQAVQIPNAPGAFVEIRENTSEPVLRTNADSYFTWNEENTWVELESARGLSNYSGLGWGGAFVRDGKGWLLDEQGNETQITGTAGTIVDVGNHVEAGTTFLISDNGKLYKTDTDSATEVSGPTDVVSIRMPFNYSAVSSGSKVWSTQGIEFVADSPVFDVAGSIWLEGNVFEAMLGTDGSVHLQPFLAGVDAVVLTPPR